MKNNEPGWNLPSVLLFIVIAFAVPAALIYTLPNWIS
jgi:hypothetical protein